MTVRNVLLDSVEDPGQLAREFAKRIVVPTDFSASSTRAWLSAIERPAEAIGDLYAIHVLASGDDTERRNAAVLLDALLDIAREHGVEAKAEVRTGDPTATCLQFLDEIKATGVITGQHGKGMLGRAILGGLSMKLLREAPCPVVVQP